MVKPIPEVMQANDGHLVSLRINPLNLCELDLLVEVLPLCIDTASL
jgi:hypothetical protein